MKTMSSFSDEEEEEEEEEEVEYGKDGTYGTWLRAVLSTGHLSRPALLMTLKNHDGRNSVWAPEIKAAERLFYPRRCAPSDSYHRVTQRLKQAIGLFYRMSRGDPTPLQQAFATGQVTPADVDDMMALDVGTLQETVHSMVGR